MCCANNYSDYKQMLLSRFNVFNIDGRALNLQIYEASALARLFYYITHEPDFTPDHVCNSTITSLSYVDTLLLTDPGYFRYVRRRIRRFVLFNLPHASSVENLRNFVLKAYVK